MTSRELLKQYANAKRNPEFDDDLRGANIAIGYAREMVAKGKLTQKEYKQYETHLWREMLDKLPVDKFEEMQADGSLKDLEALARGQDDDLNSPEAWKNATDKDGLTDLDKLDPTEIGKAIDRKVKADALELKWLQGAIDNKTYAQLSRDHVGKNERLDEMIADGDHEGAAWKVFEESYDEPRSHETELARFLNEKYGGAKKPDGSRAEKFSVERDDRSNWEKATDKDGITDIDKVFDLDSGKSASDSYHPGGYVDHDTELSLGSVLSNNANTYDE